MVVVRHDLLSTFALIVLRCLVVSNMAIMKLDICNLIHFLTFQFMVQLSVKGFLSKFKVCSFFHIRHDLLFHILYVECVVTPNMVMDRVLFFNFVFKISNENCSHKDGFPGSLYQEF